MITACLLGLGVALFAACGSNGGSTPEGTPSAMPPTGTSTASVSATPTSVRSLEDEVRAAYLAYWGAYRAALLELDPSRVEAFAARDELRRVQDEVMMLRAQGVALRVVVEHNVDLIELSPERAVLRDRQVNNSFYVNPTTKEPPTGTGSGEVITDLFVLERTGGRWVVVSSARQR